MKVNSIGCIGGEGGVRFAVSLNPHIFGVILGKGEKFYAVIISIDLYTMSVKEIQSYQISDQSYYLWRGQRLFVNVVSLVPAIAGLFYLVGGKERKLINTRFEEIATCKNPSAHPTAASRIFNNSLIVPEGQFISGYDLNSLNIKWKLSTPDKMWAFSPSCGFFTLLQGEINEEVALWNFSSNEKWIVSDVEFSPQDLIATNNLVLIPFGSPAKKIDVFSVEKGRFVWSVSFTQKKNIFPEGRQSFNSIKEYHNLLIVVTANHSLDALIIEDGRCMWSIMLGFEPIAFSVHGNYAWVGGYEGNILVVDLENGAICGETKILVPFPLQHLGKNIDDTTISKASMPESLPLNPMSIIPLLLGKSAIVIGKLRTVHYLEIE